MNTSQTSNIQKENIITKPVMNAVAFNQPPEYIDVLREPDGPDRLWTVRQAKDAAGKVHPQIKTRFQKPREDTPPEQIYRVPLRSSHRNTQAYYMHGIAAYFQQKEGILTGYDFINALFIWVRPKDQQGYEDRTLYHRFRLRIECKTEMSPRLWIHHDGKKQIARAPATEYNEKPLRDIREVAYEGQIYNLNKLPERHSMHSNMMYPVLHPSITGEKHEPKGSTKGRFKRQRTYIEGFIKKYLKASDFYNNVPGAPQKPRLKAREKTSMYIISNDEKALRFGREHVEKTYNYTHKPLKDFGAFRAPQRPHVRIMHIGAQPYASLERQKLRSQWLPRLRNEGGILGNMDEESITFTSLRTARQEIDEQLKQLSIAGRLPDYLVYISPFTKHDPEPEKKQLYYSVQELMSTYGVPGMCITRQGLDNDSFHYFVPNLNMKTLFRLGGIPWIADKARSDSLVIGLSAFYHKERNERFVASACVFNEAEMQFETEAMRERSLPHLADMIRSIIERWYRTQHGYKRIVIHYYRELSRKQDREITKVLEALASDVKVYILNISRPGHMGKLLFGGSSNNELPQNGTCYEFSEGEYTVCLNRNEPGAIKTKITGEPWPLRVRMWSPGTDRISDTHKKSLLDQLMRYARMNWFSTLPGVYPITLRIPHRLARNKAHGTDASPATAFPGLPSG